ncbi:hypothetical protein BVY04_01960 [bacterium M21]|nr:hypothetical protein BVY04_01960 [bacterium M21]
MIEKFLDPSALSRIDNYDLLARTVVEGFVSGLHKGLFHGFGSEFVQYRNYNRGDDLKHVDWKAYSRSGRLQVKVFQEETNCNCYVVLDSSASMAYAGEGRVSKLHYGKMLAASLAYLVNRQGDNVGLFGYSDRLRAEVPPGHRSDQLHRICVELARLEAEGGCSHRSVLNYLGEHFNRRGIIIMISDFLDPDEELMKALKRFRAGHHEVVLFQLLDDDELDFEMSGSVRFVDSESGNELVTAPEVVRETYKAAFDECRQKLEHDAVRNNIDYMMLRTSAPLDGAMAAYLHRRENFQ